MMRDCVGYVQEQEDEIEYIGISMAGCLRMEGPVEEIATRVPTQHLQHVRGQLILQAQSEWGCLLSQ
jgi:hypothetical protein